MEVLVFLEFVVGVFTPCVARHKARFILLVYHGDDYVVLAGHLDCMWFWDSLQKHMTVKMRGIMSMGSEGTLREIRLLNRIITLGFDETRALHYLVWKRIHGIA